MIENLLLLTADDTRRARTVAKCHDKLAARRRRIEARNRPNPKPGAAERLLVAGFCAAYLISMAGNILRIVGGP